MSPILHYHAQWFRNFYNASCLIANVYTHTWRQWQAPALSRNNPKYISTILFLLSSPMETSVSTTWNWEQMARFGFLSGMYPQWFEYASIMAYDGKDPPRGCSCLWIVMLLVFNTMHLRALIDLFLGILASQLSSVNCGKDIFFNSPLGLRKVM